MSVILIFISFLLLFVVIYSISNADFFEAIVKSMLFFSILIFFSSELLSFFNAFSFYGILVFWSLISIVLLIHIFKNDYHLIFSYWKLINIVRFNKLFFRGLLALFVLLFIQGLIYPPNNWDSMTYHMGRIPHWIANSNIESYPTHIYRQIYQPPMAELWIAQICILSKSDLLANAVQLIFLFGILSLTLLICREFDFSKRSRNISLIFIVTTPEILLQATSTQNDIVVSFYIIATTLFCIRSYKYNRIADFVFLSINSGLACYTKGTAYVFLLPILVLWGAMYIVKLIKEGEIRFVWRFAIFPLIFLTINSGIYFRNYKLTHDVMGKSEEKYFNENINAGNACLAVVKNAGLHLGVYPLSVITNKVVYKLHKLLGEKIDNPCNNWPGTIFNLRKWNHYEDDSSNLFQILLVAFLMMIVWLKPAPNQKLVLFLFLFPLFQFVIFSLVIKWQPWHTRLQTPIFILWALPVGYYFGSGAKKGKEINSLLKWFGLFAIIFAFLVIIFNPSRPYFTLSIKNGVANKRFAKYFTNKPEIEDEYQQMKKFLEDNQGKIGLIIGGDTWEYPLYYDIYSTPSIVAPHVMVNNLSKNAIWNDKTDKSKIEFIIYEGTADSINFNNSTYYKLGFLKDFILYKRK